jgi:hypothetical protein
MTVMAARAEWDDDINDGDDNVMEGGQLILVR